MLLKMQSNSNFAIAVLHGLATGNIDFGADNNHAFLNIFFAVTVRLRRENA